MTSTWVGRAVAASQPALAKAAPPQDALGHGAPPREAPGPPAPPRALAVLFFGVLCVSTAALFIRLADAPPLVTAAWRLTFASLILVPAALATARDELFALSRADLGRALAAGAMLALHFALWITSLEHTTVASSVVLVTTSPLWVGLAAPFVLKEGVSRQLHLGIVMAFAGGALIGWGDTAIGGTAVLGDALAVGGAIAVAGYFLIGRHLRARLRLLPYVALVYGTAAVLLMAAAILAGNRMTGYPASTWTCFALLALVPQILGHSSFNWALQHLSTTYVAGSVLGEPLGSTLLAWWILNEPPPPATIAGGTLILAGLAVATRAEAGHLPLEG